MIHPIPPGTGTDPNGSLALDRGLYAYTFLDRTPGFIKNLFNYAPELCCICATAVAHMQQGVPHMNENTDLESGSN